MLMTKARLRKSPVVIIGIVIINKNPVKTVTVNKCLYWQKERRRHFNKQDEIQSLRRAKNLLLSVVPNRLLLGVLCEDVEVETEDETEKEAEVDAEEGLKEEVESGLDERNVRRAGLEIEAVARSVPDLTEPEFNLS